MPVVELQSVVACRKVYALLICSVRMWCIVECSLSLPFSCEGIDIFVVSTQLFCHIQGVQVKVHCDDF